MKQNYSTQSAERYLDKPTPTLRRIKMALDLLRTALVVIDPDVDGKIGTAVKW